MAEVTAKMVAELRELTGAGMMDCKRALVEADGSIDKAQELLAIKKKASIQKKEGRIAAEGVVASYIHMGGKIGVLIEVNCETDFVARTEKCQNFVKDVTLQIAAMAPVAIRKEDVAADLIEDQKRVYLGQVTEEGKPAAMHEKIVAGKLNKWLQEICLLDQKWVKNPDKTIGDYLAETVGETGEKISIRRFARYAMGEGIEKRSNDFAAEVAAAAGLQ